MTVIVVWSNPEPECFIVHGVFANEEDARSAITMLSEVGNFRQAKPVMFFFDLVVPAFGLAKSREWN